MKFTRKVMLLAIVLATVCMLSFTCLASVVSGISPLYDYVHTIGAGLRVTGSTAYCTGFMDASSTDTTTRIKMTLQCREDGTTSWLPMKSWSAKATGDSTAMLSKTQTVSSTGYDYRVYVRGYVYDSEGVVLESASKYSGIE